MPFYDFKCEDCKRKIERQFSMANVPAEIKCPLCTKDAHRVFSMPQINMKSGFVPGINAEHDMEVGENYQNKRLYLEDQDKKGVNDRLNLSEV